MNTKSRISLEIPRNTLIWPKSAQIGCSENWKILDFCLGFSLLAIFFIGWVLKRSPVLILDLNEKKRGQFGKKTDFP